MNEQYRFVLTWGIGQTVECRNRTEREASRLGGSRSWRHFSGWQICLKNLFWKSCHHIFCWRDSVSQLARAVLYGRVIRCKIMHRARFWRASNRSLCAVVRLWCHTTQPYYNNNNNNNNNNLICIAPECQRLQCLSVWHVYKNRVSRYWWYVIYYFIITFGNKLCCSNWMKLTCLLVINFENLSKWILNCF